MPTTTLHIGTTKTGSTSIQKFLASNRDVLAKNGILYPQSLGDVPHNVIPAAIIGGYTGSSHQKMYGLESEAGFRAFVTERTQALADEVSSAAPEDVIISSEHMHSRCTQASHFAALKHLLAGALAGRDLRIIAYLRPQIDHATSLYTTMLSHGTEVGIDEFVGDRFEGARRRYHDHRKLLKTWEKQFPTARFFVRGFDICKTLPQGVITDFSKLVGIDCLSIELQFPAQANKGMSAWAAEAMRMLNGMPEYDGKAKSIIKRWLRKDASGGKIIPSAELCHRFQNSFSADNKWVAKRYFDGDETVLAPDWDKLDKPSPAPTIDEVELRARFEKILSKKR